MTNGKSLSRMVGSFTMIPNSIYLQLTQIGSAAKLVYLHLSYRRNQENKCWPSYQDIQDHTGLGRTTISKALESLVEYGLIKKTRRKDKSTIYELVYSTPVPDRTTSEQEVSEPVLQETVAVLQETAPVPDRTDIVPQEDSNKTHLTRLIEQDKKEQEEKKEPTNSTIFFSDDYSEALHVFSQATGMAIVPGGPDKSETVVKQLCEAVKRYGLQETVEYAKMAYADWCARRNKEGRLYNRGGIGWVEWVFLHEIPPAQHIGLKTNEKDGSFYA